MKSSSSSKASVFSCAIVALALSGAAGASAGSGERVRALPAAAAPATGDPFNVAAQVKAGNAAYARGDYAEAFRLFRNVAVLGATEAHYRLGVMYANGLGTRKSARQAEYWLKLAARRNFPGAAEALASVRATGT